MHKWNKEMERLSLPKWYKLFAHEKLEEKSRIYTYLPIYLHVFISTHIHIVHSVTLKLWISLFRQHLAGIGTTGYSTGPHLHFQVKRDGNNVDGMSLIDFTTEQN